MSRHVFVDETKERDYLLFASWHAAGDLGDLRKLMHWRIEPAVSVVR